MRNLTLRFLSLIAASALFSCAAEPSPPIDSTATEPASAAAEGPDTNEALETIPVTVRTSAGDHNFDVEVASTPEEQARGLMFRESLPENGGMIFPSAPRMASFWMRNTIIPLDMIFIREDGSITNIERETEPYSLNSYRSTEPVIAVLEIAGGRAAELGIEAGDYVSWPGGPRLGNVDMVN